MPLRPILTPVAARTRFANRTPSATRTVRAALAGTAVALQALAACAPIQTRPAPQAPDTRTLQEVAITRVAVIPGTPEQVFAFVAAEDVLPKVLTGYGPLPAVVRTSGHTGPWDTPGAARVVHLADGSTAREQLTQHAAPGRFAYRVWAFGNPIVNALATEARGEWTFAPDPGGTRVTWTYTFVARNAAAALPLSGITQVLWRGYMDVCLENTRRLMAPTYLTSGRQTGINAE